MSIVRRILGLNNYQPLNVIEISQKNLISNYRYLSSINRRTKIAPVLKSNAYGHGLTLVAKVLDQVGAPFFCVDSLYEAYELLKAHISTPILIMGYIQPENLKVKKLPFNYVVSTLDVAEAISKYQPQAGIHIFVDTGMNREGVPIDELPEFLENSPRNLNIEGVMSHLASADDKKDPLNKIQIKNFKNALEICRKYGIRPKWVHLQNSDATVNQIGEGNLARAGLALYGISSSPSLRANEVSAAISKLGKEIASSKTPRNDESILKPVLTFKSKIIQIKKLQKGDRVGYSGTFTAKGPLMLGVLPLGYYDGVDRRLFNLGFVTVDGVPCKIIGRVSMNIITIDLSPYLHRHPELDSGSLIGQEVVIYSSNPTDPNSIQNCAKLCRTIPYDLLVHLAASTRRILV